MQNLWERYGLRGPVFVLLALFVLLRVFQLLFQHRQLRRERLRGNYLGQAVLGSFLSLVALALCEPTYFGLPENVFGFGPSDESGVGIVQSVSLGGKKPMVSWTGPLAGVDRDIDRGDWNAAALKLFEPRRNGVKDALVVTSWDPYVAPLARAYATLGKAAASRGEKGVAKQYFGVSIELAPSADAYLERAELQEAEDWKLALDDLEQASRRAKPGDYRAVEARLAIRLAHLAQGETRGALADVDILLIAHPSDVDLLVRRGGFRLALGAVDGAIADLESATKTRTDVATRLALADARVQKGTPPQLKLALADLDRLVHQVDEASAPQDAFKVHLLRAESRHALGNASEALPEASKAIQLDPRSPEALYVRGRTELDLDRGIAAKNDFEAAIKLDPAHRRAILWHGISIYEHDPKHGLADFTRALEILPDGWAHYYRGECLLRLGQRDEAITEFTEAQRANDDEGLLKRARDGASRARALKH